MTLKVLLKLPETRLSDKHTLVLVCVKEIKAEICHALKGVQSGVPSGRRLTLNQYRYALNQVSVRSLITFPTNTDLYPGKIPVCHLLYYRHTRAHVLQSTGKSAYM